MAGAITQGQLSEDIELGGAGGGGALNFDDKGSMESIDPSIDLTYGKSAVFGDSGVATVEATLDEITPLNGDTSLQYANHATPGSSSLDWGKRTIILPEGYRGRVLEFKMQFQNTYDTSQVQFFVGTEETSVQSINRYEELLVPYKKTTDNTGLELSFRFKPDAREDKVFWGYHILEGKAAGYIKIDDVTVTPDLREIQETVFIEEPDSYINLIGSNGFGSVGNQIIRWSNVEDKRGSAATYVASSADGDYFLIEEDGLYDVYLEYGQATGVQEIGVSKNAPDLTVSINTLYTTNPELVLSFGTGHTTADIPTNLSSQHYLVKGDKIRGHKHAGNAEGSRASSAKFVISKVGSVHAFPALKDQKIEIPTSRARMTSLNALGSIRTAILQASNLEAITGDALSVDSSDGTLITVLKDGIINLTVSFGHVSNNARFAIYKNPTDFTLDPFSGAAADQTVAATYSHLNTRSAASYSGPVMAGDIFCIGSQVVGSGAVNTHLEVSHQETEVSVAINNIEPQYGDTDSVIELNTDNGFGSINTSIRRFSGLVKNEGAAITYVDSVTEGSSFIIQETGIYSVSYSTDWDTPKNIGISVNSNELTTDISNITITDRKAITQTSGTNAAGSVSWSGLLVEGDILRPHCGISAVTGANPDHFTISKVANPSITGIDGRSIDAYQEEPDSMIKLTRPNNRGSSATFTNRFIDIEESFGSDITYADSATDGASFIINSDGIYHFMWAMNFNTKAWFGFTLNENANIPITSVNESDVLTNTVTIGSGDGDTIQWSGFLNAGDVVRARSQGNGDGANPAFVHFTAAKVGSLKRVIPLIDSTIDIPTSELIMGVRTGTGSTNTRIAKYSGLISMQGEALSFSNDPLLGFSLVAEKDGVLSLSANVPLISGNHVYLTRNSTDLINSHNAYTGNPEEMLSTQFPGGNENGNLSWSGKVQAGDIFRVHSDVASVGAANKAAGIFAIHQETKIAVAISNVEPQFEDVDSMIKLNSGNGGGSTFSKIKRWLSVEQIKGGDITYVPDAVNGDSFVVNSNGTYDISWSERNNIAGVSLALTINQTNLATNWYLLSAEEKLSMGYASGNVPRGHVSWSGFLVAGDVIRCAVDDSTWENTSEDTFTFTKQALPSIASVDITPFAHVNNTVTEFARFTGGAGYGATATKIPYFTTERDNTTGDIILVTNDSTDGFVVTALKKCTVTMTSTIAYNTGGQEGGLSLNASDTTLAYNSVAEAEKLGGFGAHNASESNETSVTIELAVGNILRPHLNGAAFTTQAARNNIVVVATAQELERVASVDAHENVFSARIANNGTATITSQSSNFINSITRNGAGNVTVTFIDDFFTETPSVAVSVDSVDKNESYGSATTAGFTVQTENSAGSDQDLGFSFTVQRQGDDYKSIQDIVAALPGVAHSNSETWTGDSWIDGRKIYQRSFDLSLAIATNALTTLTTIDAGLTPIKIEGMVLDGTNWIKLDGVGSSSVSYTRYASATGVIDTVMTGFSTTRQIFSISYVK